MKVCILHAHSFTIRRKHLVAVFHNGGSCPNLDDGGQSYLSLIGIEYAYHRVPVRGVDTEDQVGRHTDKTASSVPSAYISSESLYVMYRSTNIGIVFFASAVYVTRLGV